MAVDLSVIRSAGQTSDGIDFSVNGKASTDAENLFQRIVILLLSPAGDADMSILSLLSGYNIPNDEACNSVLAIACANVLSLLDDTDRIKISSLSSSCVDGTISISLTLSSGDTISGVL